RTADLGKNLALLNEQVKHRPIPDVSAAARQAISVIAIAFEVVAPCLAPERLGDLGPLNLNRLELESLLFQLSRRLFRLRLALRDGHMRLPEPASPPASTSPPTSPRHDRFPSCNKFEPAGGIPRRDDT